MHAVSRSWYLLRMIFTLLTTETYRLRLFRKRSMIALLRLSIAYLSSQCKVEMKSILCSVVLKLMASTKLLSAKCFLRPVLSYLQRWIALLKEKPTLPTKMVILLQNCCCNNNVLKEITCSCTVYLVLTTLLWSNRTLVPSSVVFCRQSSAVYYPHWPQWVLATPSLRTFTLHIGERIEKGKVKHYQNMSWHLYLKCASLLSRYSQPYYL